MKKSTLLLHFLLLSACGPIEDQRIAQDRYEMGECMRLGFEPQTDAFSNCRLQLRSIGAQQATAQALDERNNIIDLDDYDDHHHGKNCKKTHSGWTICK
ncbi:MAG: hypothetical protein EBR02_07055 [Alphaproteobacteria bacterium]|nr:hypothetical protein [Alphaproteobacteria bacterium]